MSLALSCHQPKAEDDGPGPARKIEKIEAKTPA